MALDIVHGTHLKTSTRAGEVCFSGARLKLAKRMRSPANAFSQCNLPAVRSAGRSVRAGFTPKFLQRTSGWYAKVTRGKTL